MNDRVTLRVRMHDSWDDITLSLPAATPVGAVKEQVLDVVGEQDAPDEFVVKFRGIEVRNEAASLADADIPDGAALIVLRRRRRAIR